MKKKKLSVEQKKLDTDIWIIILVTLLFFLFYTVTGKQLMNFIMKKIFPLFQDYCLMQEYNLVWLDWELQLFVFYEKKALPLLD